MSPDRLRRIEEIYHLALAADGPDRVALLDAECGDDAELRAEVESLLSFEDDGDAGAEGGDSASLGPSPDEIAARLLGDGVPNGGDDDDDDFAPSAPATAAIGRSINQYRILRMIGAGGMGTVYLAKDTKLERQVAIKLLSDSFAADGRRLDRFVREARSASALNHPNILTVHEIGEGDGSHFIVTEFIDGLTLSEYSQSRHPTLDVLIDIFAQVASALAAAHSGGIIHRDIKPDNLMVRSDGLVKVLDFGIAKLDFREMSGNESPTIRQTAQTLPGMIIGTPQYMSPEQARAEPIDSRTDIFSFGAVLYEMIAGRPAFAGPSNADIISAVLNAEPKPFGEEAGVPPSLARVVFKSLQKNRDDRYQNFGEIADELASIRRTMTLGAGGLGTGGAGFERDTVVLAAPRTSSETVEAFRRRPIGSVALIIAVVAILAFAGFGIWKFAAPASPSVSSVLRPARPVEVISWASTPGEVYTAGKFSPDGNMIAFSSTRGNNGRQLWIKQTGPGEAIQVSRGDNENEQPVWAPSGQELAYFAARGTETGIWRTPILGGTPRLVAPVDDGSMLIRSWAKSDTIYYELNGELEAVSASDGKTRQVTNLRINSVEAHSIAVSADEKQIAYVRTEGDKFKLYVAELDGSNPRPLFESPGEIRNVAWKPDGAGLFFGALVERTFQVFSGAPGEDSVQLTFGDRDAFPLDVSPTGDRLLVGASKEESDIWKVSLKDDSESVVASGIDAELWPDVSPDGRSVAYQSVGNLSQGNNLKLGRVLVKAIDDKSDPREIAGTGFQPVWSPNGSSILFGSIAGSTHALRTTRSDGGGSAATVAPEIVPGTYSLLPYNTLTVADYSWSPDGSRVAYISRQSGQYDVWTANPDGSDAVNLTSNDDPKIYFYSPMWSPDGRRIAFTAKISAARNPNHRIQVIDVESRTSTILTQSDATLRLLGWSGDRGGTLIVSEFARSGANAPIGEVRIVSVESSAPSGPKPLTTLASAYFFNIRMSRDGRSIAYAANVDGRDNIFVAPLAGGPPKRVTGNNDGRSYISNLVWAPDGSFIVFGKQSRFSVLSMLTNVK